jgi:multicomponent Na+:H+ antiporter subunit D
MFPYMAYLGAAVLCLVFWKNTATQITLSVLAALVSIFSSMKLLSLTLKSGIVVHSLGAWGAPFGIVYSVDTLSALLILCSAWIGLCTLVYSVSSLNAEYFKQGYCFLFNILLLGVTASFSTGDVFNLYVCFELLLMSSFVLFSLGRTRIQLEACLKYVLINFIGSFFFLLAIAWIYGLFGTLNMAHLAELVRQGPLNGPETAAIYMLLICFALKAAVFPFFSWLPLSYPAIPSSLAAVFSALLTKVGIYALMRLCITIFPLNLISNAQSLFYIAALLTMLIGVFGAFAQSSIKKILSVHIISQVGYLLLALSLFSEAATTAGIYFLLHLMLTKCNLFLIGGVVESETGTDQLNSLGSYASKRPFLALNFIVSALCLAGLPPLAGFFAKFKLAYLAVEKSDYLSLIIIFSVSLITLISMLKIWDQVFWREAETPVLVKHKLLEWPQYLAIIFINISLVIFSLALPKILPIMDLASHSLWDSSSYIEKVLSR